MQNFFTMYLRYPIVPVPLGYDPMIQVIDERDLVRALLLCLKNPKSGVYNVTGPGEVPLSVAIKEVGSVAIPVLYSLASPIMKIGWWLGAVLFPTPQFDFLMYPCVIDGERFRKDFDFRPKYSLKQVLRSLRAKRRFSRQPQSSES